MTEKLKQNLGNSNPETIKNKELFTNVVRVFLSQSTSSKEIKAKTDLANISFTQTLFIKKDKTSNNPGQIMPVGGQIDAKDRKDMALYPIITAATRELIEETHLVPTKIHPMKNGQNYKFFHKHSGQQKENNSAFVVGRLLSRRFDKPYPIDIKEDRIGGFVYLTMNEVEKLLENGHLIHDNEELNILDSLHPDEKKREEKRTITNSEERNIVIQEVLSKLKEEEYKKKYNIIEYLLNNFITKETEIYKEKLNKINSKSDYSQKYKEINILWKEMVDKKLFSWENVRDALNIDNYKEYIDNLEDNYEKTEKNKNGLMMPTLYLLYPLFFGMSPKIANRIKKQILKLESKEKNYTEINFARIFEMSSALHFISKYLEEINSKENPNPGHYLREIKNRLDIASDIKEMKLSDIAEVFGKKYMDNLNENRLNVVLKEIDTWYKDIQTALDKKIGQNKIDINQNKVENKSIEELLHIIFSKEWAVEENDKIRFEAQRKLILSLIFYEAFKYLEKIKSIGVANIDTIEQNILGIENTQNNKTDFDFSLNAFSGKRVVSVKNLYSLARKAIERDILHFNSGEFNDIFRESLIFDENGFRNERGELDLQLQQQSPLDNERFSADDKKKSLDIPKCVFDYIQEMDIKAKQKGYKLTIKNWKPLPEKGKGLSSNSKAGGAKIRLCKFIIILDTTDQYGTAKTETKEVQCFLPNVNENGEIISSKEDYDFKQIDDKRYATDRLLVQSIHRSMVELLWPVAIYGEGIKVIYSKNNN